MIRNQTIKGPFICGPLLFKWMDVFQSWLDCFSIGVWAFIQNINFKSSVVFVYWCPFVTIFKWCNLWSHYTVFQVHQTASGYVPIVYNKYWASTGRDCTIFGRDYSNLNNPTPSKGINLQYICKVYFRE